MRRILIQLDEEMYRALKKRANEEGRSMASIVRESVARCASLRQARTLDDFSFVASGKLTRDRNDRVSENHDAALAKAFGERRARR